MKNQQELKYSSKDHGSVPILGVILLVVLAGAGALAVYNYKLSHTKSTQTVTTTPSPTPSASSSPTATASPVATATPSVSVSEADRDGLTAAVKASVARKGGAPNPGSALDLRQFQDGFAHVAVILEPGGGYDDLLKKSQGRWTVVWSGQNIDADREDQLGFPGDFINSKPELSILLYTY